MMSMMYGSPKKSGGSKKKKSKGKKKTATKAKGGGKGLGKFSPGQSPTRSIAPKGT